MAQDNPLLQPFELLDYARLEVEHLEPAFRQIAEDNRRELQTILASAATFPTWDNLVMAIERLDLRIEDRFKMVVPCAQRDDGWAAAVNDCHAHLSAYRDEKEAHAPLLLKAYSQVSRGDLDAEQEATLASILEELRLAGAALPEPERQQLVRTQEAIRGLEDTFLDNLSASRKDGVLLIVDPGELAGIPEQTLVTLADKARTATSDDVPDETLAAITENGRKGWLVTLDDTTVTALLKHADNRSLRETVYRRGSTLASDQAAKTGWDNAKVLQALVRLRHEKAQLLGFENAMVLSLQSKSAQTVDEVEAFLGALAEQARPALKQQAIALVHLAETQGMGRLQPWDQAYLASRLHEREAQDPEQDMLAYFPLPGVLASLQAWAARLFGITLEDQGNVAWHPDVQLWKVTQAGSTLGYIYIDAFARPGKPDWAFAFPMRSRHEDPETGTTLPIVALSCAYPRHEDDQPTLLGHLDLCKLFHEFGHCLHQVLMGNAQRRLNSIEHLGRDASEFVGKVLEQWCWSPQTLQCLSRHFEHGGQASLEKVERWLRAKRKQQLSTLAKDLRLALFDILLHRAADTPIDVRKIAGLASSRVMVLPGQDDERYPEAFDYLVTGYDASYYGYLWAEVHALDIFARFEAQGVDDARLGQRLREEILAPGALRSMSASLEAFLGRPLSHEAYRARYLATAGA
ncbi:M3 family metallopeptidase [Pseudomonas sp. S 311-6]|uniref:M3 family metallopeptidase n=1 Tax=Pseudomonas TaxID=286 RepID=UPI001CE43625|nr:MULTISPECIES: M3 family metallopeptidase [Pseudomonas]MCO7639886.1 M3 family metallopeptidase [Pseudomonas sp. S 311-6]MCO7565275.1 M3 family metallopeptidase [Pseudomonas mosselii]MCO7596132.1 M3 family metallopeptidase [Pseudomonas guariconensis]MCO7617554.1 M3 family metallopeptidase [Pseudomonas guariconensis]MCO7633767.1 M3 family metallopeptidase [Pseudomonas guariconensis]